MALLWGEVPRYIHPARCPICHEDGPNDWPVRRYIERHYQTLFDFSTAPPIDFPKPVVLKPIAVPPVYRDTHGRKVTKDKWFRQPAHHPPCIMRQPGERREDFMRRYVLYWIANRKVQGLPHKITDPFWFEYLPVVEQERKRA